MTTESDETRKRLLQALTYCERLKGANQTKLSIREVARQAGVSHALIHNRYPDIAEKIRGILGKDSRKRAAGVKGELASAQEAHKELRTENERLRRLLEAFGRQNHRLDHEAKELRNSVERLERKKVTPISRDAKAVTLMPEKVSNHSLLRPGDNYKKS